MTLYEYAKDIYSNLESYGVLVFTPESFQIYKNTTFDQLMDDDKKCLEFITSACEIDGKSDGIKSKNIHRASHILMTWLLGIGFGRIFSINIMPSPLGGLWSDSIWLQTAILHDYGYLCPELEKDLLSIKQLDKSLLLQDEYSETGLKCLNGMSENIYKDYFSYTYKEIINYYIYAQEDYHVTPEHQKMGEKNDHGIIGGCVAFDKYCKRIKKSKIGSSDILTQIQKIACITTASHNIFKSPNEKTDELYKKHKLTRLLSTKKKKLIKATVNPLLSLLSLVDTVECTKRFSAKNNPKMFLHQLTTIKYVDIEIDDENRIITLDYSKLNWYIKKIRKNEKMAIELTKHVQGIETIHNWTDFKGEKTKNNEYRVEISLTTQKQILPLFFQRALFIKTS